LVAVDAQPPHKRITAIIKITLSIFLTFSLLMIL